MTFNKYSKVEIAIYSFSIKCSKSIKLQVYQRTEQSKLLKAIHLGKRLSKNYLADMLTGVTLHLRAANPPKAP